MTQKTVTITTVNFDDGIKELGTDLRAIDPEIMVVGTVALSGARDWTAKVVALVLDGIADAVKGLVVAAIMKWAGKLFTRRKDVETVKIYGANDRDVLKVIERDKTDA